MEPCEILVETHPEDEMSNYIYADLLRSTNNLEKSIIHYKKVVQINQNQQDAWIDLLFLELQKNMIDDLIIDSETSNRTFSYKPYILLSKRLILLFIKEYKKAIESINIGVHFVFDNPTLSSEMYSILGNSYNEIKEYEKSDLSYEKISRFFTRKCYGFKQLPYYLSLRGENLEKTKKKCQKRLLNYFLKKYKLLRHLCLDIIQIGKIVFPVKTFMIQLQLNLKVKHFIIICQIFL